MQLFLWRVVARLRPTRRTSWVRGDTTRARSGPTTARKLKSILRGACSKLFQVFRRTSRSNPRRCKLPGEVRRLRHGRHCGRPRRAVSDSGSLDLGVPFRPGTSRDSVMLTLDASHMLLTVDEGWSGPVGNTGCFSDALFGRRDPGLLARSTSGARPKCFRARPASSSALTA